MKVGAARRERLQSLGEDSGLIVNFFAPERYRFHGYRHFSTSLGVLTRYAAILRLIQDNCNRGTGVNVFDPNGRLGERTRPRPSYTHAEDLESLKLG